MTGYWSCLPDTVLRTSKIPASLNTMLWKIPFFLGNKLYILFQFYTVIHWAHKQMSKQKNNWKFIIVCQKSNIFKKKFIKFE